MDALVFVHGYLGGGAQWNAQRDCFEARFNVITPDLPGFGGRNGEPAPDRVEDFAEFVLGELSGAGIETFHLVGHSMGGMVAQEMSRRAPARIIRQVFYGTGPVGALPGRFEPISRSKARVVSDGPEASARRIAATWFLHGEAAHAYEDCAAIAVMASLPTMIAGLTAMENWSGTEALGDMTAPTLVLWGDRDRTYPWSQPERLWREIRGAALAVVPGCAHAVHMEKPDIFNAILMDFLSC